MNSLKEDTLCALVAARTLLDVEGWRQCDLGDKYYNGPHCAYGAIYAVTREKSIHLESNTTEAVEELGLGGREVGIVTWNDDPKRTKRQVLTAFDKAIAKLEKEL